jgi:hypothetical protein
VVRVAGEGVASFLRRGLLGLGLQCRGDAVARALDVVADLLGGRLLAIGLKECLVQVVETVIWIETNLQSSTSLVGEGFASIVRHVVDSSVEM